jgi:hypothetical protein
MVEPGKFRPATENELSATLDVSWQAIAQSRKNLRVLEEGRAAADKRIEQLKAELAQAQERIQRSLALEQQLKQAAAKTAELQCTLDAERARGDDQQRQLATATDIARTLKKQLAESETQRRAVEAQLRETGAMRQALEQELAKVHEETSRLAAERDRIQQELQVARDELSWRDAQVASSEQFAGNLRTEADLLQRALAELDARLNHKPEDAIRTAPRRAKRVVWVDTKPGRDTVSFAPFGMEKQSVVGPPQALEVLSDVGADALVMDVTAAGTGWLSDVRRRWPELVIVLTTKCAKGRCEVDATTQCGNGDCEVDATMRSLANTIIPRSWETEEVAAALRSAFLQQALAGGDTALDAACLANSGFLVDLSHAVRAPIAAIRDYAEQLLKDGDISKAPPARVKAINTITRRCRQLLTLMSGVIAFSDGVAPGASDGTPTANPITLPAEPALAGAPG